MLALLAPLFGAIVGGSDVDEDDDDDKFVVALVVVGAAGRGLLLLLFPVLSGAGVATSPLLLLLLLSAIVRSFMEELPKYEDDELPGLCWLYRGGGEFSVELPFLKVSLLSLLLSLLSLLIWLLRGCSIGAVANDVLARIVDGERVKGDSGRRKGDVRGELYDRGEGLYGDVVADEDCGGFEHSGD